MDVNQPGALPPEVVEALRAAQARGQLPGNLAAMVAQLQRQQVRCRLRPVLNPLGVGPVQGLLFSTAQQRSVSEPHHA